MRKDQPATKSNTRSIIRRRVSVLIKDMENTENPHAYWWPEPERGKSINVQGRIDYDTADAITSLVAHRDGPWRDQSEFVRCAMGWYLAVVGPLVKRGKFKASMQTIQLKAMVMREEKRVMETGKHLDEVLKTAQGMAKMDMAKEAKRLVKSVADQDWDDEIAAHLVDRWMSKREVKDILNGRKDDE